MFTREFIVFGVLVLLFSRSFLQSIITYFLVFLRRGSHGRTLALLAQPTLEAPVLLLFHSLLVSFAILGVDVVIGELALLVVPARAFPVLTGYPDFPVAIFDS